MIRFATLPSPKLLQALLVFGLLLVPSSLAQAQEAADDEDVVRRVELTRSVDVNFNAIREQFQEFSYEPTQRRIGWRGPMSWEARDALLQYSEELAWVRGVRRLYGLIHEELETRFVEAHSYSDTNLRNILRTFATEYELNLVLGRDVEGEVRFASLDSVEVMEALAYLLNSQGFDYRRFENEYGKDVFLIVPYEEPTPTILVDFLEVPRDPQKVEPDFSQLVTQLGAIAQGGRVISNEAARIIYIEALPQEIQRARQYLQLVRDNLADIDPDQEEEEEEERPEERQEEERPDDRDRTQRHWFRINPEPNFFEQAMDELNRLLGDRPEVISDRHGVFIIEDTQDNVRLAERHISFLNDLRPGEDQVDPQRRETRTYTLKQSAQSVADGIADFLSPARDDQPAGQLVVNPQLNSLMVTDTVQNLELLERYIRELDATPQQVLIESTILEATLDDSTEFGVQSFFQRDVGSATVGAAGQGYNRGATTAGDSPFRSFSSSAYNLGFVVGNEWEVALQAIQTTLDANILSRPKLVVANGRQGEIQVGTVIPYIDVQGGAAGASQGVSFRDVLLRMNVTPHIEPGDRIRLELTIEFDARAGDAQLGGVGAGVPIISSRSVSTEVFINDGETLVIGGLYEERESNTVNKIPILGDVPVLGALFRATSLQRQKTDLLFLITPTIVRDLTLREITRDGRPLRVFRPEGPQIPEWYDDRNFTRLRGGVD